MCRETIRWFLWWSKLKIFKIYKYLIWYVCSFPQYIISHHSERLRRLRPHFFGFSYWFMIKVCLWYFVLTFVVTIGYFFICISLSIFHIWEHSIYIENVPQWLNIYIYMVYAVKQISPTWRATNLTCHT